MRGWISITILLFLVFAGCRDGGVVSEAPEKQPIDLTYRDDLDHESLRRAIELSLQFLDRVPLDRPVGIWPRLLTAGEIKESLLTFLELLERFEDPQKLAEAVRSTFEIFDSPGSEDSERVLFTGYYQPILDARPREQGRYRYPVYRRPDDLVEVDLNSFAVAYEGEKLIGHVQDGRLVPYHSRSEIDQEGRLEGRGYEIAWVKDPVDLYFLHVQGSGILKFSDGKQVHVSYHVSNGRPYRSLGRILIDEGMVSEAELSMQRLRSYLQVHSERRDRLFARNERYVFFRTVENGPVGSLDIPLTAGRSIATDLQFFPRGALAFIQTKKPLLDDRAHLKGWEPFSRFVLNQDSGSAIRGMGRVDLYFGSGEKAGRAAGMMKNEGKLYFLLKKRETPVG